MFTIRGIQEAQKANLEHIRDFEPNGAFQSAVKAGLILVHQSAVRKTHKVTGALAGSHRIKLRGNSGSVFLDPNARNPRSRALTSVYGIVEHKRGGSHAFYRRVRDEDGNRIQRSVAKEFLRGFKK
jgi:hypothetical protein